MSDKGGLVWMSSKNIDEFFVETLDCRDSDATIKINGSSPQNSSTGVISLTEIMMEEFELVVDEEYKFEKWAK